MHIQDQCGRTLRFEETPRRIISLVPSLTELLYDLGLSDKLVGITKFCIHPPQIRESKIHIGGTKNLNIELIKTLQPDLIIANKEENTKEQVEELCRSFRVYISDIATLDDVYEMIHDLGRITSSEQPAQNLSLEINDKFKKLLISTGTLKVAYLIWKAPLMTVGNDTFINHVLSKAGFTNVFNNKIRYPVILPEDLSNSKPDAVFLSSEPYPFNEKHINEFQEICPEAKILCIDGEMFSWYGSRLRLAPEYLTNLQNLFKG